MFDASPVSPSLVGPDPRQEHNCSDQSTMLHTLLYDRAMQFDKTWDSYEATRVWIASYCSVDVHPQIWILMMKWRLAGCRSQTS